MSRADLRHAGRLERVETDEVAGAESRSRSELADQLRALIQSGTYAVGDKLPGYRTLASQLRAAPNTIGEAIRLLAAEGLLVVKPNSGAYVSDPADRQGSAEDQLREARAGLLALRTQSHSVRQALDELDARMASMLDKLPPE